MDENVNSQNIVGGGLFYQAAADARIAIDRPGTKTDNEEGEILLNRTQSVNTVSMSSQLGRKLN
jgi:hypothetical protein